MHARVRQSCGQNQLQSRHFRSQVPSLPRIMGFGCVAMAAALLGHVKAPGECIWCRCARWKTRKRGAQWNTLCRMSCYSHQRESLLLCAMWTFARGPVRGVFWPRKTRPARLCGAGERRSALETSTAAGWRASLETCGPTRGSGSLAGGPCRSPDARNRPQRLRPSTPSRPRQAAAPASGGPSGPGSERPTPISRRVPRRIALGIHVAPGVHIVRPLWATSGPTTA